MNDNRRTPCNWSHFLGSVLLLSCRFTSGLKISRVVWQHSASLPVCVFTGENRGVAFKSVLYSRCLWQVGRSDLLLSTFWFSVLLLKKPGACFPERDSNMRLHLAFFFSGHELKSFSLHSITLHLVVGLCFFLNYAKWIPFKDLASGWKNLCQILLRASAPVASLYTGSTGFEMVCRSETLLVLPQEIRYLPAFKAFAFAFSLEITVMGAFIIMGEKMVVCLAIIALPAVPAFTHYFNDESLSQAGSLPAGFLFLVINCDMALASI